MVTDNTQAPLGSAALTDELLASASKTTGIPVTQTFSTPQTTQPTTTQPVSSVSSQTPSTPAPTSQPNQQDGVQQIQDYLVQHGYLTPQQVSTSPGVYGPQTTAAVAQLQKDLGVPPSGEFDSNTQSLAQKYQGVFSSVNQTQAPDSAAAASTQITAASQPSTDPVFGAMVNSMSPIMNSLTQVLQNINNPALTGVSLQQEYNQLQQQYNLPAMQTQLLNMQNVMQGTDLDIRDEISKAGGTATESQVMAMSSARNNVILRQYNSLASQYQAAQTNVQNMMQYASTDQQTELQRQQATASVTESMASIEAQMASMGMTMQQNANGNLNKIVTNIGYTGLAQQAQGNPQVLSYYESMLGLSPGSLSNPATLSQMETLRQQTLALTAFGKNIQAFNAGYAGSAPVGAPSGTVTPVGSDTTSPSTSGGSISAQIPVSSLTRPSFIAQSTPLSLSSSQMQQFLTTAPQGKYVVGGSAGTNATGNNITINGVGNYIAQPDGSYYLGSAIPQSSTDTGTLIQSLQQANPPTLSYGDIASIIANSPGSKYPPSSTAFYREQRSARQLVGNYVNSPVYQTVSNAPLPFARIKAAENGDNSVSDIELVDSYITLAKGQGQITEAQISAINSASSISDKLNIIKQKVSGAGALISADQRQSLLNLSGSVFNQYSSTYQQMYTQAINTLAKNHVEPAIWGVVPDFSQLIDGSTIDTSTQ